MEKKITTTKLNNNNNNNNNLNNNNNNNSKGKSTATAGTTTATTTANKFNLDHVYCHTSETNFVGRSNSTGGHHHQPDLMALLKENKQLKAMLLLHLDLIQEQSDQLIAKDKILLAMKEDNEILKQKIQKYEKSTCSIYNNRNIPASTTTTKSTSSSGEQTVEEKKENLSEFSNNIDSDFQSKKQLKKELNLTKRITRSTPSSPAELLSDDETKYQICDENYETGSPSIIGKSNGKLISKIILHRVSIPESMIASCTYKNVETEQKITTQQISEVTSKSPILRSSSKKSPQYYGKSAGGGKPTSLLLQAATRLKSPSPIDIKTDGIEDAFSCGSSGQEFHDSNANELNTHNLRKLSRCSSATAGPSYSSPMKSKRRNRTKGGGYLTTKRMYPCREWLEDECPLEELLNKEEEEALKADEPMLEVPKWTIKDFTGLYSIEGTEDLSDDIFLRRHSKLEHDEKRRKKWDVQRIREIRTIERLKRRHCKDEIQPQLENEDIFSFYSMPEDVKYIHVTEDLPVHAFGEQLSKIAINNQFKLPWSVDLHKQPTQNLMNFSESNSQNSQYIFLRKRRRQQSTTSVNPIKRHKTAVNDNVIIESNTSNTIIQK